MLSWLGSRAIFEERRSRVVVTLSGIVPDIDGLGLVIDTGLKVFGVNTNFWGVWHHYLHSLPFCILISFAAMVIVKSKRFLVGFASVVVFHIHLICDLIGSRGPNGYQWPIPYLSPFSQPVELQWSGQWALNAWQNIVITLFSLCAVWYFIKVKRSSPFEVLGSKIDKVLVNIVVGRNA